MGGSGNCKERVGGSGDDKWCRGRCVARYMWGGSGRVGRDSEEVSGSGSGSGIGVEGGRDGGCDREGVVVWRRLLPSLAQAPVDPFIGRKRGQCISMN